jgi:D-3-phosphoglycerate dehydrogenase / 2-oxoglutarate reductase
MRIAILDDYQDAVGHLPCFARLAGHQVTIHHDTVKDIDALATRLRDAEAVVLIRERTAITAELLDRLPGLRLISQTGKISNHLDLAACTARGIAVAEGVGSPHAPAELTWALILAARRFIPQEAARLKAGRWQTTLGYALRGATLGIWGYGKIGRLVAGFGRAFGMRVLVWGRDASRAAAREGGHDVAADKEQLFREADVLSLHLRLNDATRGAVQAGDLARMKPDALFVNTSRAELLGAGVLVEALRAGRPGYAAVDVYESEPLVSDGRGDHELLTMDNVVCVPHLGYVERSSYELYFGVAFDNIVAYAEGSPRNLANPEALMRGRGGGGASSP